MKKIVVYTAIFGAYDTQLLEVEYDREKFDFVCFTNQKRLKSKTWDIKVVEAPVPNDNPRSSYYFKTNPHEVWEDQYEMSIWMDSSCNKLDTEKLYKMAEKFDGLGTGLYIEKHPGRTCIYKELEANIHFKKDDEAAMRAHVESYRKEGMPKEFGMCETGLQFRKHNNPDVIEFQEMLWDEMMTKTRRDQLSWTYCQWKLGFTNFSLFTFEEKIDVLWFQDHPHQPHHTEKVMLVGPWYGDEKLESAWVDYVEEELGHTFIDTVVVGCRPGRESLYESIQPDKFITSDPIGEINANLLDGKVPRFNVKVSGNKVATQLNPNTIIFNRLKLYSDSVHFKIHIIGWKADKYIGKCIKSLLNQKHTNWEAQIVLDPDETNETYNIAKKYECDKIKVHVNDTKQGPTKNHRICVDMMKPSDEDVCVTLDADDWFAHEYALTVIENEYLRNPELLMTHGSWIDYPNPGSLQPNNSMQYSPAEFNNIRRAAFKASHVRTMKYKIWKRVDEEDLKHSQTGKYYDSCGDVAITIPALEMAGCDRVKFISDVLYIYNRETGLNEDKVSSTQQNNHMDIVNRKPYPLYKEIGADIIVFSKDRACQLDAFLRSMKKHHTDLDRCNVSILYHTSNDDYQSGYDKVITSYPEFSFVKESSFKKDLTEMYTAGDKRYISFFVDDIIWKNDFSFADKEFVEFDNDSSILTLSLRLHSGITYCNPMRKDVTPPQSIKENLYVWEWLGKDGDWGYPMSIDGNVFRKQDIDNYVKFSNYENPNTFEAAMATHPPYNVKMVCYNESKLFNMPINRVQDVFDNPCGDVKTEHLNEKYLNGESINIDKYIGFKNTSCHQECDIEFEGLDVCVDFEEFKKINIEAVNSDDVFKSFKRHPSYLNILEHVSERQANQYLTIVQNQYQHILTPELIQQYKQNDSIGEPYTMYVHDFGFVSPTIFRYIKVMGDLDKYFNLNGNNIIEIGGGNGGQCNIISKYFNYKTYTLVDLKEVLSLQEKCLKKLKTPNVDYKSIDQLDDKEYDLVISNYAFSECPDFVKDKYIKNILLKSKCGYLTMNMEYKTQYKNYIMDKLKNKNPIIIEENPKTADDNYIIVWGE